MKKRLLIFHPLIAPYRVDYFNSLYRAFETKVVLFDSKVSIFSRDLINEQLCFQPQHVEKGVSWGDILSFKGYWASLNEFDPDIVLVGEFGLGTLQVLVHKFLKRKQYKVVTICDDSIDMLNGGADFGMLHRLGRKLLSKNLDDIQLVEPLAAEWYQKNYRKGFPFPIIRDDDNHRQILQRLLPESQRIMAEYKLDNKNVFLYVGRFVEVKNISVLISSFSQLNREENVLVLVGSGEEEDNLRQQARHLQAGNIIFTGRLEGDSLYSWYNVADYFVLPSYLEPFGAVTNEALLAGCYCLISEKAGSACLIDGNNGKTINPMSIEDISQKMNKAIEESPRIRPLTSVKPNKMNIQYTEEINKLIKHLEKL